MFYRQHFEKNDMADYILPQATESLSREHCMSDMYILIIEKKVTDNNIHMNRAPLTICHCEE